MALDPNTQNYAFLSNNLFYTYDPNTVVLVPIANVSVGNTTVNTQINATAFTLQNTSISIAITLPSMTANTNGYVLVANGSWVAVAGLSSVNTNASYSWTNVHYFSANVIVNANLTVNGAALYVNAPATFSNTVLIGNATVNVFANASYFAMSNSTANVTITGPSNIEIQNSSGSYTQIMPGWFSISNSSPENISITPAQISVGNTSSYMFIEAPGLSLYNQTISLSNVGIYTALSYGSNGDVLASNGSVVYWTSGASVGVNTSATYTWSNAHTFQLTVNVGSNVSINTSAMFWGNSTVNTVANSSGIYIGGIPAAGGYSYNKGNLGTVGAPTNAGNIFRINAANLSANVTISNGENTVAAGPINIDTGITLTIASGGRVVIV